MILATLVGCVVGTVVALRMLSVADQATEVAAEIDDYTRATERYRQAAMDWRMSK